MIDNVRHDLERRAETTRNEIDAFLWLVRMAVIGAIVGSVWVEMRKPPEQRTWHGRLLGAIPYDYRMPTIDRLREAYWNPRSPKIITARPLGVGWAVNVPTLLRRLGVHRGFTKAR